MLLLGSSFAFGSDKDGKVDLGGEEPGLASAGADPRSECQGHVVKTPIEITSSEDLLKVVKSNNPEIIGVAEEVITSSYEARPTSVQGSYKGGFVYPLYPEMLRQIARLIPKDGKVLEVGAGDGSTSLMLSTMSSATVHVNELSPAETEAFQKKVSVLPEKVAGRIIVHPGDLFNLVGEVESGSLDVMVARNVLHMLPFENHYNFFDLANIFIKPGGTLVLSVNHRDALGEAGEKIAAEDPTTKAFRRYMFAGDKYGTAKAMLGDVYLPDDSSGKEIRPGEYKIHHIKRQTGQLLRFGGSEAFWMEGALEEMSEEDLSKFPKAAVDKAKALKQRHFPDYDIRMIESCAVMFTEENLRALLHEHGFSLTFVSKVNGLGHYTSGLGGQMVAFATRLED